jgi:RNA polymerase sigma factor (sigma-70 family)
MEFGESVADEQAQTPFEALRDQDLHEKVGDLLDVLNDREKKVVRQRFGFDGGRRKTLEEIGASLGVTRERIRQLQIEAIAKLRRAHNDSETPADIALPMAA